jgi:hypothetical protein
MKRIIFLVLFLIPALTSASVPNVTNYQTRIINTSTGLPIEGDYNVTFYFYNTSLGGSPLWTEKHEVTITDGIVNVLLGNITPFNFTWNGTLYLTKEVNNDGEMLPRTRITTVPFAFKSNDTDYFAGQPSTYYLNTTQESSLNANSSNYWDNLDTPADLNYKILLSEANISDENWIEDSQESSLNVNSSNYWDNLDTPLDITQLGIITTGTWQADVIQDAYISNTLTITGGSLNASILDTGIVPSARLSGSYTGITGLGVITTGTWNADTITDAYLSDDITANYSKLIDKPANIDEDSTDDLTTSTNFGGDVSGTYNSIVVIPNSTTLDCSNITGSVSDLCSIIDTNTGKSGGSPYLYNDSATIYLNETVLNTTIDARDTNCSADQSCPNIIYDTDEANLNVNSSNYWDNLDSPADISGLTDSQIVSLSASKITGSLNDSQIDDDITIDTSKNILVGGGFGSGGITLYTYGDIWMNGSLFLTGNITSADISNIDVNGTFTPVIDNTFDLGNSTNRWRNITGVVIVGTELWQNGNAVLDSSDEGNLNVNSSDYLDNYDSSDFILTTSESNLNVNSSNYWDNLDTPTDLNYKILLSEANISDENWIEDSQESNLNVNSSQYLGNYLWSSFLLLSGGTMTGTLNFGSYPFTIGVTTLITNLNADLLDGQHGSFYQNASNLITGLINATLLYFDGNFTNQGGKLSINTSAVQARVSGSCSSGNAIRVVNEDGTVTCESAGGNEDLNATLALGNSAGDYDINMNFNEIINISKIDAGSKIENQSITFSETSQSDFNDGIFVNTSANISIGDVTLDDPDWWNSSWKKRKKITFDKWVSGENLNNFPLLVKLNSSNFNYSDAKSDGTDLRFIDSDDTTVLKYHFEYWNSSGDSFVWVKVPLIENSSTDFIWLYYNNSAASSAEDAASRNL